MKKSNRPFQRYWENLTEDEQEKLAKEMGTNTKYLYQLAIDFRQGSPKFIKKLHDVTRGKVPKEKMLPDVFA